MIGRVCALGIRATFEPIQNSEAGIRSHSVICSETFGSGRTTTNGIVFCDRKFFGFCLSFGTRFSSAFVRLQGPEPLGP